MGSMLGRVSLVPDAQTATSMLGVGLEAWTGPRWFDARTNRVIAKTLKVVPTAAMSDALH